MVPGRLLVALIDIYSLVLLVRILFSWAPPEARDNEFYRFLHAITEPVMRPLRRIIPPVGGLDLSPILLFVGLAVLERLIRGWLL